MKNKTQTLVVKLVLFLSLVPLVFFSQKETENWFFGRYVSLSFSVSPPVFMNSSAMNTFEGCATISDVAGNMLFYTEGTQIWDQNHSVMANGSGLSGNGLSGTTQAATIIKRPGSSSEYYVFTLDDAGGPNGLMYSLVDMSIGTTGSVITKNVPVYSPATEMMTTVNHCNGKDVWLITHDLTNSFKNYLITAAGINSSPIVSTFTNNNFNYTYSQAKVSSNGEKLAVTVNSPTSAPQAGFELFDFDNLTGAITNRQLLYNTHYAYSCEFSQDGTKLYGSILLNWSVVQWDLCVASSLIPATAYTVNNSMSRKAGMQMAPDGKIYVTYSPLNSQKGKLSVVHQPDSSGSACNFADTTMAVTSGTATIGLPGFNSSFFEKRESRSFTYGTQPAINCKTVSFSPRSSLVCYPTIQNVSWNFGDANSGTLNTSGQMNPIHQFSAAGTYTVKLIRYYKCYSDTISQSVTVSNCVGLPLHSIANHWKLFPSPAQDHLTLDVPGAEGTLQVLIFDNQGRLAMIENLQSTNNSASLKLELPAGLYFIQVTDKGGNALRRKLVIN